MSAFMDEPQSRLSVTQDADTRSYVGGASDQPTKARQLYWVKDTVYYGKNLEVWEVKDTWYVEANNTWKVKMQLEGGKKEDTVDQDAIHGVCDRGENYPKKKKSSK